MGHPPRQPGVVPLADAWTIRGYLSKTRALWPEYTMIRQAPRVFPAVMCVDTHVPHFMSCPRHVFSCALQVPPPKSWLVYPRTFYTDVDTSRLLATFGEVERAGTSTREMERFPLSNDAVFPPPLWTGTPRKTSTLPRVTKCGQEPTSMCKNQRETCFRSTQK